MSTLSPTGSSRRSPLPAVIAVVLALAVGVGGGWWFAGRDKSTPAASPTTSTSCTSHSTAKATAKSTAKSSAKSTAKAVALPNPRVIQVNVYNATTRSGLARSTSVLLAARGFAIGATANDPLNKTVPGTAEIRFGRKGLLAAKVVAAQVPSPVMVRDLRPDASVDFVIGNTFTALNTPVQAQAVLRARPSPTPTAPC
jgi:LytR cell envelope-related transcriptional attenuator